MMLDIIAIIFIIGLSFVLCMKDNNYNCQMSHIVIGLSVMVFYKLAKIFKLNKNTNEAFDTTADLNAFITGNVVGNVVAAPNNLQNLSASDLSAYNDKLDALITAINNLYNQQANPSPNLSVSPNNIQKLDLESQQQYQMFQIDYLNKQIQNAKDIINAQTMAANNTNYKPIKVYSSCVISNANGTTSVDTPVSPNTSSTAFLQPALGGTSGGSTGTGSSGGTSGGSTGTGSSTGTSTLGVAAGSSPGLATSNFINLSPSTGVFDRFINNLANNNGKININL